jgi:hypothetical protein
LYCSTPPSFLYPVFYYTHSFHLFFTICLYGLWHACTFFPFLVAVFTYLKRPVEEVWFWQC